MKHQLKYLKLFEGLTPDDIPYSKIDESLSINDDQSLTSITGFNNLTNISHYLSIENNKSLTSVSGFANLTNVEWYISIDNNKSLTEVTGFKKLTEIGTILSIRENPKLVAMSIPGNLVISVDYSRYGIIYDNDLEFKSPEKFINSPVVIDDLVSKLNPGYHSTQVGIQIWENLKEWGTQATIDTIVARLTPEQMEIFPDEFKHLYHPDYKSTSGRDVAKLNTGQIYGIF